MVFKFNQRDMNTAFFFNALFTAITFAIVLVFNDIIEVEYPALKNNMTSIQKGIIHTVIIFLFTFILTYVFRFLFGWGDTLRG